jgi:hypothetical protein
MWILGTAWRGSSDGLLLFLMATWLSRLACYSSLYWLSRW